MPEDDAELSHLYTEAWEKPSDHTEETGTTDLELAMAYLDRLERELEGRDLKGSRVLDFGAGTGAMSAALAERGAEAYPVDPFSHRLLAEQGFKAYPDLGVLPSALRFDGAVAIEVVEHLPRPEASLRAIADLLADGGWLYLSTPNALSLNARIFRVRWRELHNKGHLYFFGPKSMTHLLESSGFRPRRVAWSIGYHKGPRNLLHRVLVATRLDGSLRFLAFKRPLH